MNTNRWIRLGCLFALLAMGCGDDKKTLVLPDGGGDGDGGDGALFEGTVTGDCPAFADREVVEVSGDLAEDATWDCTVIPVLTGRTFVTEGAKLTITDGTWVFGEGGSALLVTQGSELVTEGTASSPVVFTSALKAADREPGDWGGVVLLGSAPINVGEGTNQIEGIEPTDERGQYGGDDEDSSCGSIEYTRIEYAGDEFSIDNELNALTLGGCGSGTKLSHIQLHRGLDDGIEFFGGTANADHILVTAPGDDGLDWDEGWKGTMSFLVVQQHPGLGENGIEADNLEDNNDATPRSAPFLHNITLIGGNEDEAVQRGLLIRRGSWGRVVNAIVMGFGEDTVDVRDAASVAGTEGMNPELTLEHSIVFEIGGPEGEAWFLDEPTNGGDGDDDAGFVEADFFTDEARSNQFGEDPGLGAPYSTTAPDFVPEAALASDADGEFEGADYVGAFKTGEAAWTVGWTSFP